MNKDNDPKKVDRSTRNPRVYESTSDTHITFAAVWIDNQAKRLSKMNEERDQHALEHKRKVIEKHGHHSLHSCPPGTRQMCRYQNTLERLGA